MTGGISISQIGIPAKIIITPGPGVSFAGQGASGRGIAGAAMDAGGHLLLLMTDATTIDVGKITRSIARITAAGTNAATATPLVDEVSIIAAYVPGGCCVLPAIGRNVERRVSNATDIVQVIWPAATSSIDSGTAGAAVEIPPGMATTFSSPDCTIWTTS